MTEHIPVLLRETLEYLAVRPDGVYADLTLGLGGHAAEILKRLGEGGRLIGIDKDAEALSRAEENLRPYADRLIIIKSDFREAPDVIRNAGFHKLEGFIMDLGVSSLQLKTPERGFSFTEDAPLDMRMNRSTGKTAAQLVNGLAEDELARIIRDNGEERWAKAIAKRIAEQRKAAPIGTTRELADLVQAAIPRKAWPPKTHPATRTFQALRIAVNDELAALIEGLNRLLDMLEPGGRAAVLSYHSLEDRIVKQTFRERAKGCICPPDFPECVCGKRPEIKILTPHPVTASEEELAVNLRARSAKLRAAEKLAE